MKIEKPKNDNYCANVIEIKNIIPLTNCDNVIATSIFGFQAIVGKDTKIGDIGIAFTAETQLSDDYCFNNNLYRHDDKNFTKGIKGYIEDNRRVKAIKFRGNTSNCLFMPLESLRFTKIDTSLLSVGDSFDILNGVEICKKYEVAHNPMKQQFQGKKFSRVESIHMPEHIDTSNFFKYSDTIAPDKDIIVTQKIHGTSIRIGNTIVKRKLSIFEKIADKLGIKVQKTEHDYIFGSRKVIKDANNPDQNHFYESDIWSLEGKKLVGLLPENYLVYGELIGFTPDGKEIQKNYTYNIERNFCELYVYRVAVINAQGYIVDLTFDQMKEFCNKNGLKVVPEVWRGKMKDFVATDWIDKRFFECGNKQCLYLGKNDLVDEGVVIRVDGLQPYFLKAKSPIFLEHETKLLDTGAEDLESSQNNETTV